MNSKPPLILINTLIFSLTALAAVTLAPLHGVLVGYQTETLVLAFLFWAWNGPVHHRRISQTLVP